MLSTKFIPCQNGSHHHSFDMMIKILHHYITSFAIISIFVVTGQKSFADEFSGTWETNFGELRLLETDGVVIGDYGTVGVILGEVMADGCTSGYFTNGKQYGQFSFRLIESAELIGRWRWGSNGPGQSEIWRGKKVSNSIPAFSNFFRSDKKSAHIENNMTVLNGLWSTSYGELRLRESDLFLYGDYSDNGIIAARWDGSKYEGLFINEKKNGTKVGWLQWEADIIAGRIIGGSWGIIGEGLGGNWTFQGLVDEIDTEQFKNISIPGSCSPMWAF